MGNRSLSAAVSNRRCRCACAVLGILIGGLAMVPAHAAERGNVATKPATRNAGPDAKGTTAVNAAVAALLKEAQAGFKEGGAKDPAVKLRDKADYFGENPPAEVTPEAIVAVLDKPLNRDARVDGYVKWQLLSAVRGQFSEEMTPKALAAYRKAPELASNPGLDRAKLTSALFKIGTMNKENEATVNKEFHAAVDRFNADNLYVLRYRNDLYARLPVSGDSLMAGLEDLFSRVKHGVRGAEMFQQVGSSIRGWALSADRRQLETISRALGTLLQTVRDNRYKPFDHVAWGDANPMGLHWDESMSIGDKEIQDVIDAVHEAGRK